METRLQRGGQLSMYMGMIFEGYSGTGGNLTEIVISVQDVNLVIVPEQLRPANCQLDGHFGDPFTNTANLHVIPQDSF